MKVAIVASHGVWVDHLESFLPEQITAILAGGGAEMDACVQRYARREGLPPVFRTIGAMVPTLCGCATNNWRREAICCWLFGMDVPATPATRSKITFVWGTPSVFI